MFADFAQSFVNSFTDVLPFVVRIVIAAACGAAIGLERTLRQKEAGIRTHIIVALGAALMMIISKYGFFDIICYDSINIDGSRLASNIITGVSFLGSGIIIFKGSVKGLTTAAGVWTTAGIGMALGAGMYGIAIISTILLIAVQICIYRFLPIENTETVPVVLKLKNEPESLDKIKDLLDKKGCVIVSSSVEKKGDYLLCNFVLRQKDSITYDDIKLAMNANDYIISISI